MTSGDRIDVLCDLIQLRVPVSEARRRLRQFPWDCEAELVVIHDRDLERVLRGFVGGVLTVEECVDWADAVEARDDIGFDPGQEMHLRELIFQLANPELAGPLTLERADAWLKSLARPFDA